MAWCTLLSVFHYQNNLFIHKEFIQMSDRCFNTLQEQNNKNINFKCSGLAKSLARRPGAIVFSSRATKMYQRLPDGLP